MYRTWHLADFNHNALPYGGSWYRLPRWLITDLTTLKLVDRWWKLNGQMPATDGLPRIEDA